MADHHDTIATGTVKAEMDFNTGTNANSVANIAGGYMPDRRPISSKTIDYPSSLNPT